jgi:putative toxin-antitoxin system antitoxin component (TIGR02293 family)
MGKPLKPVVPQKPQGPAWTYAWKLDPELSKVCSLLVDPSPASESAAVKGGLPAGTWRELQKFGLTRDEIASVLGNSAKTIRRKADSGEPLDIAESDRTLRLLRVITDAADALGDTAKALNWMRRANTALLGKTPLEMMVSEAGTALVRRALGVIAYGGVA